MEYKQFAQSFFDRPLDERQRDNSRALVLQEVLRRSLFKQLKNTNVWSRDKKVVRLVGAGQDDRFGLPAVSPKAMFLTRLDTFVDPDTS